MVNVLIVDDEPMIRKGLMQLVKEYDETIDVCLAKNGYEALQKMVHFSPDIVFTDIRMPKMDGLELSKQIHETMSNIKIVIISGYDDFSYAQQCISYGVKQYLLKPVTETELYPVMDKMKKLDKQFAISLSDYEQWLIEMEEALWTLNEQLVEQLLADWSNIFIVDGITITQCQQLITDSLESICKRLQIRGLVIVVAEESIATMQISNAVEHFHRMIREIAQKISSLRGINQRNLFDEAIRIIDENIKENISLESISEKVGLTPTYFSFYFKKMANESFVNYRLRKRIELSKKMLEMPQYKVVDIGYEVGFANYTYFHKVFKKMTGYSPTEYRAKLGIK